MIDKIGNFNECKSKYKHFTIYYVFLIWLNYLLSVTGIIRFENVDLC